MIKQIRNFAVSTMLALVAASPLAADPSRSGGKLKEWNFDVFLGNDKVGYHRFELLQTGDRERVVTEADFKVKFAFITLYQYRHYNTETWEGDCLQRIESRTNANGTKYAVRGERSDGVFRIEANGDSGRAPGCIRTFAYWDPDFLDAPRLLNSQTGEILPVDISEPQEDTITVRGREVPAQRYRLEADELRLEIWYSMDREWLGLQSTTRDGRKIRYVLT